MSNKCNWKAIFFSQRIRGILEKKERNSKHIHLNWHNWLLEKCSSIILQNSEKLKLHTTICGKKNSRKYSMRVWNSFAANGISLFFDIYPSTFLPSVSINNTKRLFFHVSMLCKLFCVTKRKCYFLFFPFNLPKMEVSSHKSA